MKREKNSTVTSNYIDEKCLKSNKFYDFCNSAYCEAKRPDLRSETVAFRF